MAAPGHIHRTGHSAWFASPIAFTKPTRIVSKPAATPGTASWRRRTASHPLPQEPGQSCHNLWRLV
jgi:hypothetical protein